MDRLSHLSHPGKDAMVLFGSHGDLGLFVS